MKRSISTSALLPFVLIGLLPFLLTDCRDDTFATAESVLGKEVSALLTFGHHDFEEVTITTRATLGLIPESRVNNLYVAIFTSDGKRIYSHYFDNGEKVDQTELANTIANCWWVANRTSEDENAADTQGGIRMKISAVTNARLYLISNIDADMVNISPEKLNTIRDEKELQELTAVLNLQITSRNGYFPMTARAEISIDNKGTVFRTDGGSMPIELERLDAKIIVNVVVDPRGSTILDTTGDGTVQHTQKLKDFKPTSWRVINVPKGSYVFPSNEDYDKAGYFDTDAISFENTTQITITPSKDEPDITSLDQHSFSFYMLENRETCKQQVRELTEAEEQRTSKVHLREQRAKNEDGTYDTTDGLWEYAPEEGTYLEIRGEITMDLEETTSAKAQELCADVVYYIHLGDFDQGGVDDYNVLRNTRYTYTVTVKGAYKIELEVHTSVNPDDYPDGVREDQPGASGHVYIARESVVTLDAHYEQRVFSIDQEYLEPENMTWYVRTPFGREGSPQRINAGGIITEVPAGLDYKWVHFMVNERDNNGNYSHLNQAYPGDGSDKLMDVIEFTEYMRQQKILFDQDPSTSDFRSEEDAAWKAKFPNAPDKYMRHRIYFTVFVDEFYYEYDPITGETREDLWKSFVNQPNRVMQLLCDSDYSLDGSSSTTSSVISLLQRSIQTPYNLTNASLKTGWGTETVDETRGSMFFYADDTNTDKLKMNQMNNLGNTSQSNGLYNAACLLEFIKNGQWQRLRWSDFLDYKKENDECFLHDNYKGLLYATLLRNRDNDGDDIIDPEELRWYVASIEQLYMLYIGGLGLNEEAILYPRSMANNGKIVGGIFDGYDGWRNHVVSSTQGNVNGYGPTFVWAEEGISVAAYRQDIDWTEQDKKMQAGYYSVRNVRNLGMANPSGVSEISNNISTQLVTYSQSGSGASSVYRFDLNNVNDKSIRFYTTRELEPGDGYSEMSRTYYGFETGEQVSFEGTTVNNSYYPALKTMLERGESPCPVGYRVPNLREAALMYLFCRDNSSWWTINNYTHTLTSTYYSLGVYGNKKQADGTTPLAGNGIYSWNFGTNVNVASAYSIPYVRCVRDVR